MFLNPDHIFQTHIFTYIYSISSFLAIAEARRSFLEGSAFQSGPVEKTATDLDEIKRGSKFIFANFLA
jgi:hypothetical protein